MVGAKKSSMILAVVCHAGIVRLKGGKVNMKDMRQWLEFGVVRYNQGGTIEKQSRRFAYGISRDRFGKNGREHGPAFAERRAPRGGSQPFPRNHPAAGC
jgi:hypothetical protein